MRFICGTVDHFAFSNTLFKPFILLAKISSDYGVDEEIEEVPAVSVRFPTSDRTANFCFSLAYILVVVIMSGCCDTVLSSLLVTMSLIR